MTLPYVFASQTAPVLTWLDADFAAVGALTTIPCTVAGTDALVLTPAANTPAIPAYANYMQFSCVVSVDNTGVMTARIGSLAVLSLYKDTAAGPAVMAAADLQAGNFLVLTYDSALNTGAGGFHAESSSILSAAYLPLAGGTLTGPLIGTSVSLSGNASVASLNIAAGSRLSKYLTTTSSIVFGDIAPTASTLQTVALTGASISDIVMLGVPAVAASLAGIAWGAYIAGTGLVAIKATNTTAGTVTPAGGVYRVGVMV